MGVSKKSYHNIIVQRVIVQTKELTIKMFREKLEQYYKNTFSKIKIFGTDILLDTRKYYQDLEVQTSREEVADIGKSIKQGERYLLKGIIGCGKTTFIKNICYEWSIKNKLQEYKLIVYLELKDNISLEDKNISSLIKNNYQAMLNGFEINQILNEYQDEILFIFDGLDELQTFKEKDIFYKIYQFVQNGIVVSRTNSIDINKLSVHKIFEMEGFIDIFSLKDIKSSKDLNENKKSIVSYCRQLFGMNENAFPSLFRLTSDDSLYQMLKNPLFMSIMRNNMVNKEKNNYEIYQHIITDIILEYNKSLDITNIKTDIDSNSMIRNEYIQLNDSIMYKLAIFSEKNDLTKFKVKDINYLLTLGFLTTQDYKTIKQYNRYEFIYDFFQEYFKAYYLVTNQDYSVIKKKIEAIESLEENIHLFAYLNLFLKQRTKEYKILMEKFKTLFNQINNKEQEINILYITGIKLLENPGIEKNYTDYINHKYHDSIEQSHWNEKIKQIFNKPKL